ncbi:MAG: hypothetical protein ACR2G5_06635 [Pyrinomonadaceae bacterium]
MFFATDIADFLACQHIAALELAEAAGEIRRRHYADPGAELLRKLGLEHEQKYLRELVETKGLKVVEIPTNGVWSEAAAATREAMAAGAEAIYQGTFMDGSDDTEPPVRRNHPRPLKAHPAFCGWEGGFSLAGGDTE